MYDVNITIVNWRNKDDIDLCLESLFKDMAGSSLDIVVHVIDNSSNSDGIREMIKGKYSEVKYHDPGENIGFGRAHNLGFKMAESRYYLALNPDCEFIPDSKVVEKLVSFLKEDKNAGIVGPKLLNEDGSVQDSCFRFPNFFDKIINRLNLDKIFVFFKKRVDYYLMRDFEHNFTVRVDWLLGAFLLIKREVVEEIGFFDERFFMYFEDCDLCRLAWTAGWQVYYVGSITVKHKYMRESAKGSQLFAVLKNPTSRFHIVSWLKYFRKWRFKKAHFGI